MNSLKQISLTKIANTILDSPPDIKDMVLNEIDQVNVNRMKEYYEDQLKMLPYITRGILQDIILNRFDRSECEQRYIRTDNKVLNAAIDSVFKMIDDLKSFNILRENMFNGDNEETDTDMTDMTSSETDYDY